MKELIPTKTEEKIFLNEEKTGWIIFKLIEEKDGLSLQEFEELFLMRPKNKVQVMNHTTRIIFDCPRYATSYLKP